VRVPFSLAPVFVLLVFGVTKFCFVAFEFPTATMARAASTADLLVSDPPSTAFRLFGGCGADDEFDAAVVGAEAEVELVVLLLSLLLLLLLLVLVLDVDVDDVDITAGFAPPKLMLPRFPFRPLL
jgi:hypothetical protein